MLAKMKFWSVILASLFIISKPINAFAISLEVARKCNALTSRAYPPLVPGNPAAGRANGNGQTVRNYFNRCIAHGGHMHKRSSRS